MIGRVKEQKTLLDAYKSEYSEFVAVYGRRRIGKTFLVRETFKYSFTFQHAGGAKESLKGQLGLFRTSLQEYGHNNCPELKTWHEAFNQLKVLIQTSKTKKKTIFLDEAAWMDTPKSNFLSALEFFWNSWASNRKDVLLIICASATSWIVNKVFKNRGGLHNRVTVRIALAPFTLRECEQFSREKGLKLSRYQILSLYMVMGGVALYWTMLDKHLSAVQNIDELFFNRQAKLKGEFNDLYDSLFKHPDAYKDIIVTLGKHLSGLTRKELLKYTGQADNGVFSDRLTELEECGFIMKMRAFPKDKKEAVYKLCDNFTIFYFKYIKSNSGIDDFWARNFKSPSISSWSGFAFERVCLQHISQIKKAMGIAAVATTEHIWRFVPEKGEKDVKGAQIDLLIDRSDNVISICEMKWASEEYVIQKRDVADIRNKVSALERETGVRKAVHITMVTTYGVKHNMYYDEMQSEVVLDQLFD
ncbi:MAG: ATP-binding protein [Bacteroidales bacterium]|nr:ATP-binding protein [Bacteroidales bacterium]